MSEQAAPSSGSSKRNADRVPGPGRGLYILPSIFTVGTMVCGFIAILSALKGTDVMAAGQGSEAALGAFDLAAKAIGWAVVFDGLDGRIARWTNSSSDFGREFDSLADVITFGLAPALLAYAWGVRQVEPIAGNHLVQYLQKSGWIITFGYVICGAARLARFNIDRGASPDRRQFIGLPIPAAAGVVAAIIHWAKYPVDDWRYGIAWLVVVGVSGFLMVSTVRYSSFKNLDFRRRRSFATIILIFLVIWLVWTYSELALLVIALTYAASGPLSRLITRFRPHSPSAPPESSKVQAI